MSYADAVILTLLSALDLFWALQGAGHNFGIVTEVKSRIYNVPSTKWAYVQYIFTHDKVEKLFTQLNEWTVNGTYEMPVNFINENVFACIPAIDLDNVSFETCPSVTRDADAEKAVIVFNIFSQGADTVPVRYTERLLAIGPVVATANATDYPGLTTIDGTTIDSTVCQQHDSVNMMFPIGLKSYNIQAQRDTFDAFNAFTADAVFTNSAVLIEAYSTQAVKAVAGDSTAFPHRGDNIVMHAISSLTVQK